MADFVLGRIKFKWRGDWAVSTAYLIDDIVKYGGNTYVVIENHTSQSTIANFYTDLTAAKYSLHTEGLFFKGGWVASTFYKLNDLVKNGAYQYRCILQHTSAGSFAIGSNWQVFTEGLQWEDSYSAVTTYSDGDVVTYGGYTYVYVNDTPASGQTPTDNAYWDVVTTGYNATGVYSHGTGYKTGDVVNYGGNSYVANANHSNQYPAVQATGALNSSYWDLVSTGLNYRSTYSNSTTYNINDVISFQGSSYVQLKDRQLNITPGTDATVWKVLAQGDVNSVLEEAGDMTYLNTGLTATRLDLGPAGSILTSNGTIPEWRYDEGTRNVLYVANSGNDSNPGTKLLPFKTIKAALSASGKGDVLDISSVSGGSGGTAGVFTVSQSVNGTTSGSGTGFTAIITKDGSSAVTTSNIQIVNGGKNYVLGDTITISSGIGGAANIILTVGNVSFGDVVWVKAGTFRENLPLVVPAGVTVRGEGLRATEVRPNTGSSSTIATVTTSSTIAGANNGTYKYLHQTSTSGAGAGIVVHITISGGAYANVEIYHGGYNYNLSNTITFSVATIGCGGSGNLTLTVSSLENNNASYMWLLNDGTNLRLMTLRGMTGTSIHLTANTAFGGAVLCSLDPEGNISTQSPYCQDMTSINANAVGVKIDGLLHGPNPNSNKSILGTHFTQINSDGIGIWCHGNGRAEMVSCFTYYCIKSYYASEGGFIRGLNGSSCYGEEGAVAEGSLVVEQTVGIQSNGEMLKYGTTFGGGATESDIENSIATNGSGTATVLGLTSGATATIFRYNTALNYLHIKNRSGNFQKSENIRITKENSSTFTVNLDTDFGQDDSTTIAQSGQVGPLISLKSGTTILNSAGLVKVGSNLKFTSDSKYYRINAVSEENTIAGTLTVRLTEYITTENQKNNSNVGFVSSKFSNVRLTGHDFLDVGTGDIITTNYPGVPSQVANQEDEVRETDGGRVYFVSTDQDGDFRVGDLFRIQQSTGVATLNADAFDLSGLSELQLGSIGAELGATINEFSTDQTLAGDSNTAVPTERAIKRFVELGTSTLTNKTINLSNNTITGTVTQFNTALSDGDFATLAGSEALTNKTISGLLNTISNIGNSSLTNSSITIRDSASTTDGVSLGETLVVTGGTNITTSISNNTLTINTSAASTGKAIAMCIVFG